MARPARRFFHRIWDRVDEATWRAGAWLRRDELSLLVPATFRRDGKYLVGRNGRLFLGDDGSRTPAQHSGRLRFTDSQLDAWQHLLERRARALAQRDCAYLMLIPPNAHSVYPEDLPPAVPTAPERPVHQLLSRLAGRDSMPPVLYPLPELLERKPQVELFPRTETHWNEVAAFIAYDALVKALRDRVPMRRLEQEEFRFVELDGTGDLGVKRRLPRRSPHLLAYPRHPNARVVEDNLVESTGSLIATECPVAPDVRCVVFGDSYTYGLLPFLSESVRRLVFAQTPALDWTVIERERPDLVLTVISERFLIEVPDDDAEEPVEDRAIAKTMTDMVRPRLIRWDGERHLSPAAVEAVRAHLLAKGAEGEAAMVSTLAYAGLRPIELQWLRWRHVRPDVLATPSKPHTPEPFPPPREWPIRQVRMPAPLAADLAAWRAASDAADGDLVFPSPFSGGPWAPDDWRRWADESYLPALDRLGLDRSNPGALRLTFIALAIQSGVTPARLAAELGESADAVAAQWGIELHEASRVPYAPVAPEIERSRRLAAETAPPPAQVTTT
jgi:integrase